MADALADIILAAGGEIHVGDPVVNIEVEDHWAQKVLTRNGKEYTGDLYISDFSR